MTKQVIGGRYELQERVGRGGMASVYRAKDLRLLRDVAIKLLAADGDDESAFYFHREARAIAALHHQNIIQIFDYSGVGESPSYIVMEFVEGGNIDQMLLLHHPLPEEIIVSVIHGMASSLGHAHHHGVIHRDIKPANVMVNPIGRILLTDFGIAKPYRDEKMLGKTLAGRATELFGTPDFMAPEQILEHPLGPHTDIFSLGCLLYCLATNNSPFDHPNTIEILRRVVDGDYIPLKERRPDLRLAIHRLVDHCLQLDPHARPSAEEVVQICDEHLLHFKIASAERALRDFIQGNDAAPPEASTDQGSAEEDWETAATEPTQAETQSGQLTHPPPSELATQDLKAGIQAGKTNHQPSQEMPKTKAKTEPIDESENYDSTIAKTRHRGPTWALLFVILTLCSIFAVIKDKDGGFVGLLPALDTVTDRSPAPALVNLKELGPAPTIAKEPTQGVTKRDPTNNTLVGAKDKLPNTNRKPAPTNDEMRPRPPPILQKNAAQKQTPGTIVVTVRPWGTVFVDGKRQGNTPMVRTLKLQPGNHIIDVRHPVLGTASRHIKVLAAGHQQLVIDLRGP